MRSYLIPDNLFLTIKVFLLELTFIVRGQIFNIFLFEIKKINIIIKRTTTNVCLQTNTFHLNCINLDILLKNEKNGKKQHEDVKYDITYREMFSKHPLIPSKDSFRQNSF